MKRTAAFRRLSVIAIALLTLLWPIGARAVAAPVLYDLDIAPDMLQHERLTIAGDQVTAVSFFVVLRSCTQVVNVNAESVFGATRPLHGVTLVNRRFEFHGRADASLPGGGSVQFTVTGTLAPDRRLVSGTFAFSNGRDAAGSGCSGTFQFLGLPQPPAVGPPPPPPNFISPEPNDVRFDYHARLITHLSVGVRLACRRGGTDLAYLIADRDHVAPVRVSPTGSWRLHLYVFDNYMAIFDLTMTGHISTNRASGSITVAEPRGFALDATGPCAYKSTWSASGS